MDLISIQAYRIGVKQLTLPPGCGGLAFLAHSFTRPFAGKVVMANQTFTRFCRECGDLFVFRRQCYIVHIYIIWGITRCLQRRYSLPLPGCATRNRLPTPLLTGTPDQMITEPRSHDVAIRTDVQSERHRIEFRNHRAA